MIYLSLGNFPELKSLSRTDRFKLNRQVTHRLGLGWKYGLLMLISLLIAVACSVLFANRGWGETAVGWVFYAGLLLPWLAGYLVLLNLYVRPAVIAMLEQQAAQRPVGSTGD